MWFNKTIQTAACLFIHQHPPHFVFISFICDATLFYCLPVDFMITNQIIAATTKTTTNSNNRNKFKTGWRWSLSECLCSNKKCINNTLFLISSFDCFISIQGIVRELDNFYENANRQNSRSAYAWRRITISICYQNLNNAVI